jgi:glycosyltransferase involved in cell wall biosynthesis
VTIALLQGAPVYGGIEDHYVRHIVSGLRDAEEDVALLLPDVPAVDPLRAAAGGSVRVVDYSVGSAPRVVREVARRLRTLRPRLAHAMDVWPAGVVAARLARVPRVIVTHHTPGLPRRDNLAGRALWQLSWLLRPEVVYIAEANRRLDGRTRLRTHVMDYGIDVDRFAAGRRALPANGPIVGSVARLSPQKSFETLVAAAPAVLARHPSARFVLVGDGESRAELERLVRDAGLTDCFLFTGTRDDVPDLLASFDVYVLPSLFEGLPHSVLEAQAAGVPVVATPVGGTPDAVVHGETGLLVPVRDPPALADAVLRLLENPDEAQRLAVEARRRVYARFSVDRLVARIRALYAAPR